MNKNRFPPGWDEERVRRVLAHYERQADQDAVKEDEATFKKKTMVEVPRELVPLVRELVAKYFARSKA